MCFSHITSLTTADPMKYLKRLSDQNMHEGPLPWEFVPETPIPEECRLDKKERTRWINLPSTDHHVYSGNEGVNANARITAPKGDGEGNPIRYIRWIVSDYDKDASEAMVMELAKKMPFPPNWIERTLSGNWRFVWILERPLLVPSFSFAQHFFRTFDVFAFNPANGMVGFDKEAFESPERLWTNGCDWRPLNPNPIPEDVSQGWMVAANAKFEFSQKEFGEAIDLDIIRPALAEKYPTFAEWDSDFVEGAHGPTFWVPASKSPKSATVYPNGMRTFSANAHKAFFSWADLLGMDFVKRHQAESSGRAAKDIYYDGRSFYRKFPDGVWRDEDTMTLSSHLEIQRGVSVKSAKGETGNELKRTIDFIRGNQRVDGVAPALYRPSGFWINENGKRMLNTSRVQVMQPAQGIAIWGPNGTHPWLSHCLDYTFDPQQAAIVKAWAQYGYQHAYAQKPRSGHVLFIAGPVNIGKTLINRGIFGRIFGGCAEAAEYLMGETDFNGDLFDAGYWVVDDNAASSDPATRKRWTFTLKKLAANKSLRYHEKFKRATMAECIVRICVTMNCDEVSVQLLPDMDASNLEKCIIVRTLPKAAQVFPHDLKEILDRELPWLCRWFLDNPVPAHLMGDPRFGLKSFADESLLDTARQSSPQAGFSELLENWKGEWFGDHDKELYWEGTATELYMAMGSDPRRQMALGKMSADSVGRHLSAMKARGCVWIESFRTSANRRWRIFKDENRTPTVDNSGESV